MRGGGGGFGETTWFPVGKQRRYPTDEQRTGEGTSGNTSGGLTSVKRFKIDLVAAEVPTEPL
jgi:hypothetical protein